MKTIYLDFDGVLHQYTTPWAGADVVADPPVEGAIEWLRHLLVRSIEGPGEQFEVAIYSSRNAQEGGIPAMQAWLEKWGLDRDMIPALLFPTEKGPAHLTLDDRALTFTGPPFPTVGQLLDFVPWNRRI